MNKPILVIGALLVAGLVCWAVAALIPDETRIRWLIGNAVESFNSGRASACLADFADDYVDETSRLKKVEIVAYLRVIFISRQNHKDGRFRYPVTIPDDGLRVEVTAGEPACARIEARVLFHEIGKEDDPALWEIDVEAELSKESGAWQVKLGRFRNVSGKLPF